MGEVIASFFAVAGTLVALPQAIASLGMGKYRLFPVGLSFEAWLMRHRILFAHMAVVGMCAYAFNVLTGSVPWWLAAFFVAMVGFFVYRSFCDESEDRRWLALRIQASEAHSSDFLCYDCEKVHDRKDFHV